MPMQKDLKRLVRGRMKKTGESYTTARLHLTSKKKEKKPDYAALAGMSDEKVKAATGCDWETWVKALDYAHADQWAHRDIARYIKAKFDTPDWWTQTVTVGYERIRGLRAIGQRRSGTWEANKSRTFAVPVGDLFDAFARWAAAGKLTVRTKKRPKTMRVTWSDASSVELSFIAKGDAKSTVTVQHTRLPSKADADRMKAFWGERFDELKQQLT